jgi:hypothetical protein
MSDLAVLLMYLLSNVHAAVVISDVYGAPAVVGLPGCCCGLHNFCKHIFFCWAPYCVGGPVVAFPLLLLAFILSWAVMLLLSSLLLLVAGVTTVACFTAVACIPVVVGIRAVASVTSVPYVLNVAV